MTNDEKAVLFNKIRDLMGYVEDGSDVTLKLYQDDATKTFHVQVGSGHSAWGETFSEAINNAYEGFGNESPEVEDRGDDEAFWDNETGAGG